jgi:hypothetical protein
MRAWWAALSRVSLRSSPVAMVNQARVGGVSWDVHVDLTGSTPELMIQAAIVRGSPHVAKVVQHISEQGREA